MQQRKPSRTALAAAVHRAAHQILEQGRIFPDPLALRILGGDAESLVRKAAEDPDQRRMRIFIAVRTRFAEDALAAAIERGVRQLVVLGAGLDTYAYRGARRENLRIFEVDHPATQEWKKQCLQNAGIPVPASLTFVPIEFECNTLAEGLSATGFDPKQPTFFTWLGVVPYLKQEAVVATLTFIAGLPNGAHVVFDYSDPPARLSPDQRARHEKHATHVASLDEPWITYFEAEKLQAKLRALAFIEIEDLGPAQIAARYFPTRFGPFPNRGGHIVRATTINQPMV